MYDDDRQDDIGSDFEDIEPWREPVDGGELLDRLVAHFKRYLSLESGAAEVLTLWTVATHAVNACQFAPRLFLRSPVPRCGKTTALGMLGHVTRRPRLASNITPSSLFRIADAFQPTLLIDEADTFLARNRELTGILNSGHNRQTAFVERTETVNKVKRPARYSTFTAIGIAAIGRLPATVEDRSVIVPMRRKGPNDRLTRFREDRAEDLTDLARMAARWVIDNFDVLREADPRMPEGLNSRAENNYRMLIAIADIAGDDWPERAREAIKRLAGDSDEASPAEVLLGDIQDIFDSQRVSRISSAILVERLTQLEHRPWGSLKQHALAKMLTDFEIAPKVVRIGTRPAGAMNDHGSPTPSPDMSPVRLSRRKKRSPETSLKKTVTTLTVVTLSPFPTKLNPNRVSGMIPQTGAPIRLTCWIARSTGIARHQRSLTLWRGP
jgi:putative DNA primase/helicase